MVKYVKFRDIFIILAMKQEDSIIRDISAD